MVVKIKESFEKTRHNKKYILRGERNVRYHDRILSNENKILVVYKKYMTSVAKDRILI